MYWVELVHVCKAADVPGEFTGFVRFQAEYEGRELTGEERVAILKVEGTACYIPVFLDDLRKIEDLEERLRAQEARMTSLTRREIIRYMGEGD